MNHSLKKLLAGVLALVMLFALLPAMGGLVRESDAAYDSYVAVTASSSELSYSENGTLNTGYGTAYTNAVSGTTVTLPTPAAANIPSGYEFVGWSTTEVSTTDTAPTTYTSYTPTGDVTFYAVYAVKGATNYTLVTDISTLTGGTPFIIYSSTASVNKGYEAPTTYRYLRTNVMADGKSYLIAQDYNSVVYVLTGVGDSNYNNTYPYFVNVTETLNGGYYAIAPIVTTYGTNVELFEYLATASDSSFTLFNATTDAGYLSFTAASSSGTHPYKAIPRFVSAVDSYSYWTWTPGTSTGTLYNTSWDVSGDYITYRYAGFVYYSSEAYLQSLESSSTSGTSNINLRLYEHVDGYNITNALTRMTSSNSADFAAVGSSYSATLTASTGYTTSSVVVTMGGVDVTSSVYNASTGVITISEVYGDVVVTASATANPYTVTFMNGETTYATQTVGYGGYATAPQDNPTSEGYMFSGWALSTDPTTIVNIADIQITAATTFVAVFSSIGGIEWYEYNAPNQYGLPKSDAYIVTSGTSTGTHYEPVTDASQITEGADYLIGYVSGSTVYLLMNKYDGTDGAYYSSSANYYSYGATGTLDANGYVTALDSAGRTSDFTDCEWRFSGSNSSGYSIYSVNNNAYYLGVWTDSTYYSDLYASTTTNSGWKYNFTNSRLYYYVSSSITKYITYVASLSTSYPNMFSAPATESSNSSIVIFRKVEGGTTITDYNAYIKSSYTGNSLSQSLYQRTNVSAGDTFQLNSVLSNDFSTAYPGATVVWSIDNTNVASIDQTGLLTATGNTGEVEVTITVSFVYAGVTYALTDHFKFTASTTSTPAPFTDTDDLTNFPQYPQPGSVLIDKTVSDRSNFYRTGVAELSLSVKGIPVEDPIDVVLVFDLSGSMGDNAETGEDPTGTQTSKLADVQTAAVDFITQLVKNGNSYNSNRIGLVTFSESAAAALALQNVSSDTELAAVTSTINGLTAAGGTNYDSAFQVAYNVLSATAADNRPQYVIFLTDGAPGVFNGLGMGSYNDLSGNALLDAFDYFYDKLIYTWGSSSYWQSSIYYKYNGSTLPSSNLNSNTEFMQMLSDFWSSWVCGTPGSSYSSSTGYDYFTSLYYGSSSTTYVDVYPSSTSSPAYDSANYAYNDNIYAARLKGTLSSTQLSSWFGSSSTAQLGAKIYTLGFGMSNGSSILTSDSGPVALTGTQVSNLLNRIATTPASGDTTDYSINAANSTQLSAAFSSIASTISGAVSNAVVQDTVGQDYDVRFATVYESDGTTVAYTPSFKLMDYGLNSDYEHSGAYSTTEEITFTSFYTTGNFAGLPSAATSSTGTAVTIDANGTTYTLTGEYITYTKDIQTSEEVFTYTFSINASVDVVFSYPVYLNGSYDDDQATPAGGVQYPTNEEASITYDNYLGVHCKQTFDLPSLPWLSASVEYEYYLVDINGNPVNSSGQIVTFANRVIISRDTETIPYNVSTTIRAYSYKPSGYVLFAPNTFYTLTANLDSDGSGSSKTGSARIFDNGTNSSGTAVITTRLFKPTGATATLDSGSANTYTITGISDYSNTGVSFGVVINAIDTQLEFQSLGAQAHIIHKTESLNQPMYTNGIRFAVSVNYKSLQEALNVGDYFNLGVMMLPTNRLLDSNKLPTGMTASNWSIVTGGDSANTGALSAVQLMQMSISSGLISTTPGSTTTGPSVVFFDSTTTAGTSPLTHTTAKALTLDTSNMIRWNSALDTASSLTIFMSALNSQATALGLSIKTLDANTTEGTFTYCVYIMFSNGDAYTESDANSARLAQANREIAYRGVFVKLSKNTTSGAYDNYDIQYTYQKTNSATRIFRHYFRNGVTTNKWANSIWLSAQGTTPVDADLNGWSLYGPPQENQITATPVG